MKRTGLLTITKSFLQKILGFQNYLYCISIIKYYSIRLDKEEKGIYKFIKMIPDGSLVLDIGSNIGVIASTIAKNKKSCTLYCFEPIPVNAQNIRRLSKVLKLQNVVVQEMALGNSEGNINMVVPEHQKVLYEGHSHILTVDDSPTDIGLNFTVAINKLDNVFNKEQKQQIKALKLDVENYEYEVLKGAREILSQNKPIIFCELWDNEIRFEVIDYLKNLGYECFVNKNNHLIKTDGRSCDELDFFFLHKESANIRKLHTF